ncbi:hypothetical protein [Burkholderia ubonensis]|uniref:hypothetical protein n=1 Tax=Burkholderia ubonensis TaxID=101571 RepID=UPI0012FAD450|nr:hypothetical protein [Burkholderia ubonensis]
MTELRRLHVNIVGSQLINLAIRGEMNVGAFEMVYIEIQNALQSNQDFASFMRSLHLWKSEFHPLANR